MAREPSTDALTDVDTVRAWLNKTGAATAGERDKLQLYVNAYSRAIRRYTGRLFLPTESTTTKKFRYDGMGFLAILDVKAVTAVVLNTDLPTSSRRTLAVQSATVESEFRLEPREGSTEGTYTWMSLPELGEFNPIAPTYVSARRRNYGYEVSITGDWGIGEVPGDVEIACLIAVANAVRNPEQFAARALGDFNAVMEVPLPGEDESGLALPRGARSLLSPYKRRAMG